MIRNFSKRNLEKTLQIYDRNENKKTGQTQKEETEPKRSSKAPETIKVDANANDILGMQNLSMISYNNKKNMEKDALSRSAALNNQANSPEAKEKAFAETQSKTAVETKVNNYSTSNVTVSTTASNSNNQETHPFLENPENFIKEGFDPAIFEEKNLTNMFPSENYNIKKETIDSGKIYAITDKNGNEVITIEDCGDNLYQFKFSSSNGTIIKYTTEDGELFDYTIETSNKKESYDENGKLFYVYNKEDKSITRFNKEGKITSVEKNNGITEHYENGKLSIVYDDKNNSTRKYNSDGSSVLTEKNGRETYYNADGSISHVKESSSSITDMIKNEIHKTNWLGLPSTADDLNNIIKNYVNADNVVSIIDMYKDDNNEDIFEAIFDELGLSGEEKAEIALYLKDQIMEHYKAQGVYTDDIDSKMTTYINYQARKIGFMNSEGITVEDISQNDDGTEDIRQAGLLGQLEDRAKSSNKNYISANGEIDSNFYQQITGDCWLLAAIKSIASTPEGLAVLNDMITVDKNGNVTVEFKHLGKTYLISKDELEGATEFSTGDSDVRAIEIAFDRYVKEQGYFTNSDKENSDQPDLWGNKPSVVYAMILGTENPLLCSYDRLESNAEINDLIEKVKNNEIMACCSIHTKSDISSLKALNSTGGEVDLVKNHAYAIVNADEDFVYIVNPWNTSEVLKITHDDFQKSFNVAYTTNLDDVRDANPNITKDSVKNDNNGEINNKQNNQYIPTIDGGELPEVVVTGKAGDKVTVKDGHTFIAVTDEQGNVNYRVQDQDGNVSYVSQEVFDKLIKNGNSNIKDVLNDYGTKNSEDVSEELIGHNWTDKEKANVEASLKETYGDYQYSIVYNFDGSYSFEIFTRDGKHITPKEALIGIDKPLEYNTSLKQDIPDNAKELPELKTGWEGQLGQDILNKYTQPNGTINVEALKYGWEKQGGKVYEYTDTGAQNAYNAALKAENTGNWDKFWNNASSYNYTEDWSWTGFDVMSFGGNPYGNGIVYNEYGQIDYRNSWFSLGGGGGSDWLCDADGNQFANHKDVSLQKHAEVMIQECR